MRGPKLTATERDAIKARIAAGDAYPDIAAAFGCTISNVKYYAGKIRPLILAGKREREVAAIDRGLSEADARVAQLEWLNALLAADLATGLYGMDIKLSATGKAVEVAVFKGQQAAQLRGTLDDIAKERGGRRTVAEVTGKDGAPFAFTLTFDRVAADAEAGDHLPEAVALPEATERDLL